MANERRGFLDPDVLARLGKIQLAARGLVEGAFSGVHKSPHRGSSVEFAQYREYAKGDDTKHLDWRLWGRSDRYYIKEFEADTNLRLHLLVDCSASMGFGAPLSKLDYARKLAGTLAYIAVQQGDAVGLTLFSDHVVTDIPPRHNPAHLRNLFDALETAVPAGSTRIPDILHAVAEKIRRRAMAVVVSDLFEAPEEVLPAFAHFCHRKHDLAVFHLLDPQERDFPFERPTCFVDLESSQHLTAEPALLRKEYLRNLGDYLEKFKTECSRNRVDYNLVHTDTPYDTALADFLRRRQK